MVLKRADEPAARAGIAGMRTIIRALIAAGIPLVFGPGAIHLPTVPDHRKWNRIDLGTADKVASAALGIVDQAERLGIPYEETQLRDARARRRVQRGAGRRRRADRRRPRRLGRARSARARAARSTRRRPISSAARCRSGRSSAAGRSTPTGTLDLGAPGSARAAARGPARARRLARARGGRREGRARADRVGAGAARGARGRSPGRGARAPRRPRASGSARVAPVRPAARGQERGARRSAPRGRPRGRRATRRSSTRLRLREARGGVLDHLRMYGAERIVLG